MPTLNVNKLGGSTRVTDPLSSIRQRDMKNVLEPYTVGYRGMTKEPWLNRDDVWRPNEVHAMGGINAVGRAGQLNGVASALGVLTEMVEQIKGFALYRLWAAKFVELRRNQKSGTLIVSGFNVFTMTFEDATFVPDNSDSIYSTPKQDSIYIRIEYKEQKNYLGGNCRFDTPESDLDTPSEYQY